VGVWGRSPRRHEPPSGSGVARVSPIRPALRPPAIVVFMALYSGVSALLNRPVPRGVELAFARQLHQQDCAGKGAFDLAVIGTIPRGT